MGELKCTKCKQHKQPEEFYNDQRNKTGKSSICKQCQFEYKKVTTNNRWKRTYKCKECEEKLPIEHYLLFNSGNRSRVCKTCTEHNKQDRVFELWYNNNKESCETFLKHLREVTGINGEEDLLKKYHTPK